MSRLLIHSGTIVNEGRRFVGYVVVDQGVIVEVGEGKYEARLRDSQPDAAQSVGLTNQPLPASSYDEVINASGKLILPGVIDPHVHFREPGLTEKGDMASESKAAVAGGVTTVLEMPNTSPPTVSIEFLERKMELAREKMQTKYGFFVGATRENIAKDLARFNASKEIAGVKVFIGSSTGDMLVDDERSLSKLFAEYDGVIVAHCEDEALIRSASDRYRREEPNATTKIHPLVRSSEACYVATARAIELAEKYGTRLHVAHVTTARELTLLSAQPTDNKRITAEACIPHLWFTDGDYARLGNLIKCNPAIKTAKDRLALRQALGMGKIDIVATDHAPHTKAEKLRPYWEAPSGIPMVQHSLVVMLELAGQGVTTLETVVQKMCHAPAVRFGLDKPQNQTGSLPRGFLRPGYAADIAIVDPAASWVVSRDNILYKCGWSPLEGNHLFSHKVVRTIIDGKIVNFAGANADMV